MRAGAVFLQILLCFALFTACTNDAGGESERLRADSVAFENLRRIKTSMDATGTLPNEDFEILRTINARYPQANETKQTYRQALMLRGNWTEIERDFSTIPFEQLTADEKLVLAQSYGKLGKYRDMAAVLEPLVEAEPGSVARRGMLAFAYFHLDEPEKAAEHLDSVWEGIVSEKKVDEITLRGLIYLREKNIPRAIEILKQAVELNPKSSAAHNALSRAYSQAGNEELSKIHRAKAKEQYEMSAASTFAASRRVGQIYQLEAAWKNKNYPEVIALANEMMPGADGPQKSVLYQYIFESQKALGNEAEANKALEAARGLQQQK